MTEQHTGNRFPVVGDGSGLAPTENFYIEEVQLALRNRGMPLEALRYPITPTGIHYLLTHFDIPFIEAETYRLNVGGLVSGPLELTLDDIRQRPSKSITVTMECAGNGRALLTPRSISQPWVLEAIGTAQWTGTPLKGLLEDAGIGDQAVEVLFTGVDQGIQGEEVQYYQRSLTIEEATFEDVLLAYEMNGAPLEPQHGYPLRLVVPGWYGMTNVKWLGSIEIIDHRFDGYQMDRTYRYTQTAHDLGDPVDLMRVRALMVPPGIPDFMTRTRLAEAGNVELTGRAWSGRKDISRVEISDDGGSTWSDAQLGERVSAYAWRGWSFAWNAEIGRHTLCVRATDSEGNVQPVDEPWNYQGMGNNMVHKVDVIVE